MTTAYELDRFVAAQNADGIYLRAVKELRRGAKTSHWMWFVFPQIAGLGRSTMSRRYALVSLDEAGAFLTHDVLGSRLIQCAGIVADTVGTSAEEIFGGVDALKLHSSMTLFHLAAPDEPVFSVVLQRYFDGVTDPATSRLIAASRP